VLVILTFTLGIGIVTAVCSIVNAVLLRPLPFADPDRLVQIETVRGGERGKISLRELDDLRERSSAFEAIAGFVPGSQYSLAGDSGPEKAEAILVTHDLFRVLGVPLLHGETFPESFDRERHNAIVLSYGLWRRQFGGDAAVVGRTITLDSSPVLKPSYVVAGVMPRGFDFPAHTDLYRSLFISPAFPNLTDRARRNVVGVARVRRGLGLDRVRLEAEVISHTLAREFPASNRGVQILTTPLADVFIGPVRPYVWLLLGAVVTVLIIATANVANLLLSRAIGRRQELALRRALGASRRQLIRQLITEGVVLAMTGGALGVVAARACLDGLMRLVKLDLPTWISVTLDGRVLAFAVTVSAATGVLAAVLPALRTTDDVDGRALQAAGGRSVGSAGHTRLRRALLAGEVAVSVLLLVGAGLMGRTFLALWNADTGFQPRGLLTFKVALPVYYDDDAKRQFQRQLLEKLTALPGASGAACNANLPLANIGQAERETVLVEGQAADEVARNPYVNYQRVCGDYFGVMRLPIVRGRALDAGDRERGRRVAVVSRRFAERFWPGSDAVGRRLRKPGANAPWVEIVGVAGDVRHESIADPSGFAVYLPAAQAPNSWMHFIIRAATVDPMGLVDAATQAVRSINPQQPVNDVEAMQERALDTVWQQRAAAVLLSAFGAMALLLASIGIYGVVSYTVGQRMQEFGVRRALGASPLDLLGTVLADTAGAVVVGAVAGLAGSAGAAVAMRRLLFGVAPIDALTFVGVPVVLSLVAIAAALVPARRATRVDPLVALRDA
jgi:putative ABC transport system permease protein